MSIVAPLGAYPQEPPAVREWLRLYDALLSEPERFGQSLCLVALQAHEHFRMTPGERERARVILWGRKHPAPPSPEQRVRWQRCQCFDCLSFQADEVTP